MSVLDRSEKAVALGGFSPIPREDYVPAKSYRRDAGQTVARPRGEVNGNAAVGARKVVRQEAPNAPETQVEKVMEAIHAGAQNTGDIAEQSGLERVIVVRVLPKLVQKGVLVDLPREHRKDRRVALVGGSKSKQEMETVNPAWAEPSPEKPFTEEDMKELRTLVQAGGEDSDVNENQTGTKVEAMEVQSIAEIIGRMKKDLDSLAAQAVALEERAKAGDEAAEALRELRASLLHLVA